MNQNVRTKHNTLLQVVLGLVAGVFGLLGDSAKSSAADVDYNRDIRPLLSNNCYACHGPDEAERKAGLRLDDGDAARAKLPSENRAIVPGMPDRSELLRRVTASDPARRMPPPNSTLDPLSDADAEKLRTWIASGAEFKKHWAFETPARPPLPDLESQELAEGVAHPRNAIDLFIRKRLSEEGLQPAPEADKRALIRRVTLDLTGLPPTPEEVEEFLANDSPTAYEELVDRLLASPRYGEHQARYWLDAVRYGDTHGLHLDNYREIWPYREWVINAFNKNQPFDEFTIDQLAGDLRENPTDEQLVATGYVRSNITTNEGGAIVDEVLVRNTVDRVETTGTVWLGLTAGCAVCHDHKFDPLTQKEFYQLYAFFNSTAEPAMDKNAALFGPTLRILDHEEKQKIARLDEQIETALKRQKVVARDAEQEVIAWAEEWREKLTEADIKLEPSQFGLWHDAGTFTASDGNAAFEKAFAPEKAIEEASSGLPSAWKKQPQWKDGQVHFLEGDYTARYLARRITAVSPRVLKVSLGSDDGIKIWLNGTLVHSKFTIRGVGPDQDMVELNLKEGDNFLLMKIANQTGGFGFYFKPLEERPGGVSPEITPILRKTANDQTAEERKKLVDFYKREVSKEWKSVDSNIKKLREQKKQLVESAPGTLVAAELEEPRPAFMLNRGQYDQPTNKVERALPKWLPPLPEGAELNRMGFAQWLVADSNPLMSRVVINRFWQRFFGIGIVRTSEDFGIQSEFPSHPELLDWLAVEFRESDWNVKHMMRLIVTSSTYRQQARVTPEIARRDPENRLLARGPRYRMDAEVIRDQALFVSGLLVERLGGPSVKPYQPPGIWHAVGYTSSNTANFKRDDGDALYRRSLYTFWKRTAPPPAMSIMDAPTRESCTVRRPRTNTPLAALALMNDVQFVEAARHLAQRVLTEAGADRQARFARLYSLTLARLPTPREREILEKQLTTHLERFERNPQAAKELLAVGESGRDSTLDASHHAAWAMLANLVLNLDETLNK